MGINKRSSLFPVLEEASDSRSYLKRVKWAISSGKEGREREGITIVTQKVRNRIRSSCEQRRSSCHCRSKRSWRKGRWDEWGGPLHTFVFWNEKNGYDSGARRNHRDALHGQTWAEDGIFDRLAIRACRQVCYLVNPGWWDRARVGLVAIFWMLRRAKNGSHSLWSPSPNSFSEE